jgi:hypothetical protein
MVHGNADGSRRSTAEIEQDIERIRAELGLTLEALRHRLTARHLLQRGIDMITEAIGEERGVSIGFNGFRADPIALALLGIGVAWLIAANTGIFEAVAEDERVRAARRRLADLAGIGGGEGGASAGQEPAPGANPVLAADERGRAGWVHQAADAARGAIRAVRDTAGEYTGRPVGWLRAAGRTARDRAGYAGERAGNLGGRIGEACKRHPLLIGAAGLCAGALVAGLLPLTRTEARWVGKGRERVLRQAGELGRETIRRVRRNIDRVAEEAVADDGAAG